MRLRYAKQTQFQNENTRYHTEKQANKTILLLRSGSSAHRVRSHNGTECQNELVPEGTEGEILASAFGSSEGDTGDAAAYGQAALLARLRLWCRRRRGSPRPIKLGHSGVELELAVEHNV